MKVFSAVLACLVICGSSPAQDKGAGGRTRSLTAEKGQVIRIDVRISKNSESLTTVVEFAGEKSISSVVQAFSKDDISLEAKQNRLFIKLLADTRGYVDVIGGTGSLYRLLLEKSDGEYDALATIDRPKESAIFKETLPKSLELMRSMRLMRVPEGGSVAKAASGEASHRTGEFELHVLFVFDLDELKGFVCRLTNRSKSESYDLDLSRFESDSLLLIGARDLCVAPSGDTLLFFVFHEGVK